MKCITTILIEIKLDGILHHTLFRKIYVRRPKKKILFLKNILTVTIAHRTWWTSRMIGITFVLRLRMMNMMLFRRSHSCDTIHILIRALDWVYVARSFTNFFFFLFVEYYECFSSSFVKIHSVRISQYDADKYHHDYNSSLNSSSTVFFIYITDWYNNRKWPYIHVNKTYRWSIIADIPKRCFQ